MTANNDQIDPNVTRVLAPETYPEMVARLFKEMDTDAATLIHAAIGMTGECGELKFGVINRDEKNVEEELGDFRFYFEKLRQRFGFVVDEFYGDEYRDVNLSAIDSLLVYSCNVQDLLKKYWVYNKPLDVPALKQEVGKMFHAYTRLCALYGLSDVMVCAANQYKLSTGPNARYPLGYSDAAAIARADKAEGE